jgi:hypothetical protein
MSWLFSQALVAGYWGARSWDGALSAPLNLMPSPRPFLHSDKMTDFSPPSQFGLTLQPLMANRGAALLMSYLVDFLAKTLARPARELVSRVSDPASGWKWPASFVKYDPASRSWKTRQSSLLGGLAEFSETWPRWGSMLDGECLVPTTLAPLTSATGYGSWPTPTRRDGRSESCSPEYAEKRNGEKRGEPLAWAVRWQTPVADDSVNRTAGKFNSRGEPKLSAQVKRWPTPHGFSKDGKSNGPSGNELGRAVNRSFPTPVSKSPTGGRMGLDGGSHARAMLAENHGDQAMKDLTGGSLNPPWVEWLMGWPIGWTDLNPLETAKFRQWLRSHGTSSPRTGARDD